MFTTHFHIGCGKRVDLVFGHNERAVYPEEIVLGKDFFDLPQLKLGDNGFLPGAYPDVFLQAFDIQDLVEEYFYFLLAYIKKQVFTFGWFLGNIFGMLLYCA